MKFCNQCGAAVEFTVPEGDDRARHVCPACGTIHYQNPKIVVGCIPAWEDRILLCRRAIEPRYGFWTLPAGFMENGETSQQGAARETLEEARAREAAFDQGIKAARARGLKEKDSFLQEAGEEEKRIVGEINAKAQAELASVREKISSDAEAVRAALQGEVEGFAKAIGQKILGRAI